MQHRLSQTWALSCRALATYAPDRWRIAGLLGLMGLATLISLVQVWPLAFLVDWCVAPGTRPGVALSEHPRATIIGLALALLGLKLAQELVSAARNLLALAVHNAGLMRIRCALFHHVQALHLGFHREQPQGDLLYRLTTDTQGFQTLLDVMLSTLMATLHLVAMLAVMLSRNVPLTLLALSVAPLLIVTNMRYGRILKDSGTRARERESQLLTTAVRALGHVPLTQAFGREQCELERFRRSAEGSIAGWSIYHTQEACYRVWVSLIFAAGSALIFGYGGWLVYRDQVLLEGAGRMTAGDLIVFLTYLGQFYDPLCRLSGASTSVQGASASVERVFAVLDQQPLVRDCADALPLHRRPRALSLRGVGFSYPSGRSALQTVTIEIPPGSVVGIVGPSGAGKSTLLNLLPRFIDATVGAVCLDGIDVRRIALADLRRHLAIVPQETLLLPTTIGENIAYGRPHASRAEIEAAARLSGADTFISELPLGFDTPVLDGGSNLSGGQRQRLGIARALLTEAPILVFDEPTSALDPLHEQWVTETLSRLKGTRTVLLVSHRLSTVAECDCIYVLERGTVVERGSHAELLAAGGLYARLADTGSAAESPRGVRVAA